MLASFQMPVNGLRPHQLAAAAGGGKGPGQKPIEHIDRIARIQRFDFGIHLLTVQLGSVSTAKKKRRASASEIGSARTWLVFRSIRKYCLAYTDDIRFSRF
jgi:hypothetical protein